MTAKFSDLRGRTIIAVTGLERHEDEVRITTADGAVYRMFHEQDCCEHVWIEDVVGDLSDILFEEVTMAEESSQDAEATDGESATWTFYKLGTAKGSITIRWFGSSNGYYSESADFELLRKKNPLRVAATEAIKRGVKQ